MRPRSGVVFVALALVAFAVSADTTSKCGDKPCPFTVSAPPQVVTKTATGDPVISANSNEIVRVRETSKKQEANKKDSEAVEAERELKTTKFLNRAQRKEKLQKRQRESGLKQQRQVKIRERKQRRKQVFKAVLKRKREEGKKYVKEKQAKFKQSDALSKSLGEKIKQQKLAAIQKEAIVDQQRLENKKKAWKQRVEFKNKQTEEEGVKDAQKAMKQRQERKNKKADLEKDRKAAREETQKQAAHKQTLEQVSKRQKEKSQKRKSTQEAVSKKSKGEQSRKAAMEKNDKGNERKWKGEIQMKEREKKKLERAKKRAEQSAKFKEKTLKNRERMKKEQERRGKKAAERAQKQREREKKVEKGQKENAKKVQMERKQKAKMAETNTWCNCKNYQQDWRQNNKWFLCPGHTFLTGLYRGAEQFLSAIQYYTCCYACRKDKKVLKAHSCTTGNWASSFDYAGWSMCPTNHFVKGFYKSSCNWIYCLEYAQCCKMEGSRGWQGCSTLGRWGSELDYAGWKQIDSNNWIAGLYRSGGHYLYNIEYAQQCKAYSY